MAKKLEVTRVEGQDNLKCVLTDKETLDYGKRQARLFHDLQTLSDEGVSFTADLKGRKATVEAELNVISERIRNGYEHRFVQTEIVTDWEAGLVRFVRRDTGETYAQRPLNTEERQTKMDLESKPESAA